VTERSLVEKGYVGETYVIAKLIRDFNMVSARVPQQFFSYDLITSNNKRLEVKTAVIIKSARKHEKYGTYYSDTWEFRRNPRQLHENASDFIVCVCFKSEDFSEEPRCFIIPSMVLREHSEVFKINANIKGGEKLKFWEYKSRWDLIVNDNSPTLLKTENSDRLPE
jgi:hypothetical protein